MQLNGVKSAAPIGIGGGGKTDQEADSLDEERDEARRAAFERGVELNKALGCRYESVLDEEAELSDSLVGNRGSRGGEAGGEGIAGGGGGVEAERRRCGAELAEDGGDGEALEGGLREARLLEELAVGSPRRGRLHFRPVEQQSTRRFSVAARIQFISHL